MARFVFIHGAWHDGRCWTAVIRAIEEDPAPVILVGHSLGGITLSPVAEAIPERLSALVYLAAFLLPPGTRAGDWIHHPTMETALVTGLLRADPAEIGALRIDTAPTDSALRNGLRDCFYGDLTDEAFEALLPTLHCDEPAQVVMQPARVTPKRFGRVPRHHIVCNDDRAIPLSGQEAMIADAHPG